MDNMTILSQQQFECALKITSVQEAAEALRSYQHFRTLGDVLKAFCDDSVEKKTLVAGLLEWFPESKKDAVDKKVRNWLAGKNQLREKADAFILAHILNLTLDKTNEFLKLAVGEGIHWRDPEEIVWSYAILHHLSPDRTRALLEHAKRLNQSSNDGKLSAAGSYTTEVFDEIQPVLLGSEEGLISFITAEREKLGKLHNTAYQMFMRYITLLEKGFADDDIEMLYREMTQKEKKQKAADAAARKETARKEAEAAGIVLDENKEFTFSELEGDTELYQPEKLTTRDVLEAYLYRSLVPAREEEHTRRTDPFFAIRHSIRRNWPDEFTLSKMKNRQTDVSRKALILLFLATDGSNSEFEGLDEEEQYTQEEAFQDIYIRLNLMLTSCGFLKLDPRSAFDWMVLFCISTGDLWESDARIQSMLLEIFPTEEETGVEG